MSSMSRPKPSAPSIVKRGPPKLNQLSGLSAGSRICAGLFVVAVSTICPCTLRSFGRRLEMYSNLPWLMFITPNFRRTWKPSGGATFRARRTSILHAPLLFPGLIVSGGTFGKNNPWNVHHQRGLERSGCVTTTQAAWGGRAGGPRPSTFGSRPR